MTDEELDALVERLDNLFAMLEEEGYYTKANTADFARKAITTLRAQLAEARSELSYTNKRLEHAFERIERQARTIDDLTVRTNRAEAELAAQIEEACAVIDAHAEYDQAICCDGRECGCQGVSVHDVMKQYIRQPHDRSALDRMLAEAEARGYEIAKAEAARDGWHLRRYDLAKRDAELANAQP